MKPLKIINKKLIKNDFYSTEYFKKTYNILKSENIKNISVIQFKTFHKEEFMVCGVYESIEIIKTYLSKKDFKKIEISYVKDGTVLKPESVVLSIKGPYYLICKLENIIDGILARRSSVANNCYQMLKYLKPEQLIFMSDRSDDYHLMPFDGYSAYVGGVRNFSNDAHVYFLKQFKDYKVLGTMPHALIQQNNGDIIKTFKLFKKYYKDNVTMLVDYENDVISTLNSLKPYLNEINAIRIDTSNNMIDKSLTHLKIPHDQKLGSNQDLIKIARKWLDQNNFRNVKIICSSGNNLQKIKSFYENKIPVDCFGIGSSLTKLNLHFTADLVMLDDDYEAKKGRTYISTEGMEIYKNEKFS